jgi:4a-hydroxytetrahydrobiopterin dehydratase
MEPLSKFQCVGCHSGEPSMAREEIDALRPQVPHWRLVEVDGIPRLERTFVFPDFAGALAFANRVGAVAEEQGHHPGLLVEWGKTTVTWWTHATGGLHRNDFIMAAKTDTLYHGE